MRQQFVKQALLSLLLGLLIVGFYQATETLTSPTLPASDQNPLLYSGHVRDDLEQILTRAIEGAQQSVLLIIYTLTDPKIIQALNRKSEEGIPVRVIYDGKASPYVAGKLNPKISRLKRFGFGLMHQKILLIDGKQLFLGSANMTGESLRMHANLIVGMESPALGALIAHKAAGFEEAGANAFKVPHQSFLLGGQELEIWFLPDDPHAVERIKTLIQGARKSIRVAMFTWTRHDFAEAIVDAYKRGIHVEVVLDYNQSQGASSRIMKFLIQRGIPVRLSRGSSLFHHKFLYIDGETLVNGSTNWTKAAFTQNDDCFIVLHSLTDAQRRQMEALWKVVIQESEKSTYK